MKNNAKQRKIDKDTAKKARELRKMTALERKLYLYQSILYVMAELNEGEFVVNISAVPGGGGLAIKADQDIDDSLLIRVRSIPPEIVQQN